MLNRIVWNRTDYLYKNGFGIKQPTKVDTPLKPTNQHAIKQSIEKIKAIVVKAALHKPIHICSIYIPPHDPISDIKMNKLLQQILKLYLLLGNLNNHSTVWGCKKTDKKAKT